mgnify:CR=1 FL=1
MGRKVTSNEERFWRYVDKSAGPDGCWLWTGAKNRGYGSFSIRVGNNYKMVKAHRYAHELLKGPIPEGMYGLHACNQPSCVNPHPNHVNPGTQHENLEYAAKQGRTYIKWLSEETVSQIREMRASGAKLREIADTLGLSIAGVGGVCKGTRHAKEANAQQENNKSLTHSGKETSQAH